MKEIRLSILKKIWDKCLKNLLNLPNKNNKKHQVTSKKLKELNNNIRDNVLKKYYDKIRKIYLSNVINFTKVIYINI